MIDINNKAGDFVQKKEKSVIGEIVQSLLTIFKK